MPTATRSSITALLQRASVGDRQAGDLAFAALYDELRRNARAIMRSQVPHHTLDAESLLHEAYVKVSRNGKADWASRGHFLAVMSRAMRQFLIDYAKQKHRKKRGGGAKRVPLTGIIVKFEDLQADVMDIHEAIERLRRQDPEAARAVELQYFVGLKVAEIAEALGVATRSLERDLNYARTWLRGELAR